MKIRLNQKEKISDLYVKIEKVSKEIRVEKNCNYFSL